jgi:hypothetical protein
LWGLGFQGIDNLRSAGKTINILGWVGDGNGIIQYGTQTGAIGLLLFALFLFNLKKNNIANNYFFDVLYYAVIIMPLLNGIGDSFWFSFLAILNVKITTSRNYIHSSSGVAEVAHLSSLNLYGGNSI